MPRLYVKPNSKIGAAVVEVFALYGIKPETAQDQRGTYYKWSVPEHWNEARRARFAQAILLASNQ